MTNEMKAKTKAIGIRLPVEMYDEIIKRATKRNWDFGKWVRHTLTQELRKR